MDNLQTAHWDRRVTVRVDRDKKEITVKSHRRTICSFLSSYIILFSTTNKWELIIFIPYATWQPINDVNADQIFYAAWYVALKFPSTVHKRKLQFILIKPDQRLVWMSQFYWRKSKETATAPKYTEDDELKWCIIYNVLIYGKNSEACWAWQFAVTYFHIETLTDGKLIMYHNLWAYRQLMLSLFSML